MTHKLIETTLLEQVLEVADKFISKVETGQARSVETYNDLLDVRNNIRAALANAEPTGWKPIETAPATANKLLAFSESGNMKIETGHWLRNMLYAAKVDGEHCNYTHWMPLPTPPKDAL